MVSYLVMKNNIKRLMVRKSTYVLMLVIPFILVIIGSVSVRIENRQIRVGVLGGDSYIASMTGELQKMHGVVYQIADAKTIHTDTIMGKYQYVLNEQNDNDVLQDIGKYAEQGRSEKMTVQTVRNRMVSMLFSISMTIATLYGMYWMLIIRFR